VVSKGKVYQRGVKRGSHGEHQTICRVQRQGVTAYAHAAVTTSHVQVFDLYVDIIILNE
jgi:hypothetical protein